MSVKKYIITFFILFLMVSVFYSGDVKAKKSEPKYLSNAVKLLLKAKNATQIKRKARYLPQAHHQVRSDRNGNVDKKENAKKAILNAYKLLKQKKVDQADSEIEKAIMEIKAAMTKDELNFFKE